jgi:nucleoside-diphosphate-sugar epimerase
MFTNNELYKNDVEKSGNEPINWEILKNKSILITGASGLIGTFLIDILMYRNNNYHDNITIYAVVRNMEKARRRFHNYLFSPFLKIISHDIQLPFTVTAKIHYVIHGASNTHPEAYSADPINTLLTSILGTNNILKFSIDNNVQKTIFLSTVEIYGENRGDTILFDEGYCGYINCNTARACYPEGKRAGEALCQLYIVAKDLHIVIARCCRVYGPTMADDDSKNIAQFIKNALKNENIVLKSRGNQLFSFCYIADICTAILYLILDGKSGEAYNIANTNSILSLYQIAQIISCIEGKSVVFDIPSKPDNAEFPTATKALLDCKKIKCLGWEAKTNMENGLKKTLAILKSIQ